MKKTILLIIITFVFTSCSLVLFKHSVPEKAKVLENFPKKLIGKYISINNNDTLTISNKKYQIGKSKKSNLIFESGDLSSNEFLLKRLNTNYILNIRKSENEGYWIPVLLNIENNILKVSSLLLEKEDLPKEKINEYKKNKIKLIKTITNVEVIIDGKNESYLISPTDNQLNKMIKNNLFEKVYEFKKLNN